MAETTLGWTREVGEEVLDRTTGVATVEAVASGRRVAEALAETFEAAGLGTLGPDLVERLAQETVHSFKMEAMGRIMDMRADTDCDK